MAAPLPYVPSYSFTNWQTGNPTKPLPAAQLDNELAGASLSTKQLVAALGKIQRSDGALKNGIVTPEALSTQILAGLAEPTPWVTGVLYPISATVFEGPRLFICGIAHVSGVFETDLAAGKWTELADFTPPGVIEAVSVLVDPGSFSLPANVQAALELLAFTLGLKANTAALGDLAALNTLPTNLIAGSTPLGRGVIVAADTAAALMAMGLTLATLADIRAGSSTTALLTPAAYSKSRIGELFMWPASTPPASALVRNGASLLRTAYPELFEIIGTTYGSASGTTFSLPDDRGYFERGWDGTRGIDPGRTFGSLQDDAFKSHTHPAALTQNVGNTSGGANTISQPGGPTATGATGGTETRPKNRAYLPCIWAK